MNTRLQIIALAALTLLPLYAVAADPAKPSTDRSHKVVFEVAMDGADKWQGALRNVENVRKSLGAQTKVQSGRQRQRRRDAASVAPEKGSRSWITRREAPG